MTKDDLLEAAQSLNVLGFLALIREGESNQTDDAFFLLYGGGHFTSFADHPRIHFPITYQGKSNYTTAAGAFQITETTWNEFSSKFGANSFTPENQTLCAIWRLGVRGALADVLAGRLHEAIRKLTQEWTSLTLPKVQEKAEEIFTHYGGALSRPTVDRVLPAVNATKEVKPMEPTLLLTLLGMAGKFIPQILGAFSSDGSARDHNIAAATVVGNALVDATQSPNLQAAVERIATDPEARAVATRAVAEIWPTIFEVGGGVETARKSASTTEQLPFYKQGVVWVTAIFVPLIYLIVIAALGKSEYIGDITSETRAQVIGTVLGILLGGIVGYFYGTSAGSQRKTDLLGAK